MPPATYSLPPDDLLRDRTYRHLWIPILISSFGGQLTLLAVPLTAAVLLHATPTQMAWLTTTEIAAFVLLSLPAGVWIGEHVGLRYALAFAGIMAVLISIVAWRQAIIRDMRTLPMASGVHRAADAQLVPDSQPGEFVP